jgi:uncharacterized membrane protein YfcA
MTVVQLLLLVLLGCAAGFLAGLFGVGGGIVLIPFLLLFFQLTGVSSLVATHLTLGTSLAVIVFTSLASANEYRRNNHIIWKGVVYIGLASVAGAGLGSMIAGGLEGKTLQRIFALVVVVAAFRMLGNPRRPKKDLEPRTFPPGLLLTGFLVGLVSSLSGVGGGVLSIPVMYSILHFPLKKALGTSSASIVITAFAATTGYIIRGWENFLLPPYTLGYVSYLTVLPIVAGSIPMARIGATLADRVKAGLLRKAFVVFLLVVAVKMFFF